MSNYNPNENKKLSLDEIEEMEQEEKRKKKKKFNIFSHAYDDGKGVDKDEIAISDNPNLINFFKLIGRKINQILSVNIIFILSNFPIFFFFLGMSGYFSVHTTAPVYSIFAPLRGAMMFDNSAATAALGTIFSRQAEITVHTTADYIFFGIAALTIITFGLSRIGITYILRNMFRGEPVFLLHDFFYVIKRNLRQGIIYGIIDVLITFLIAYDIVFFNLNYSASFGMSMMFFASLCLALIYFFMRHYIYLMLITFDLSIFKMFKNALYFTVLGIKRNFMAFLGTILLVLFEYFLMIVYPPLAAIVPFVILPSLLALIGVYAAYPKIKEIMIDPYYEQIEAENESEDE